MGDVHVPVPALPTKLDGLQATDPRKFQLTLRQSLKCAALQRFLQHAPVSQSARICASVCFQAHLHRLATLGAAWREQGRRGVWLSLSVDAAFLVPVALKEGFVPHHCDKSEFVRSDAVLSGLARACPSQAAGRY